MTGICSKCRAENPQDSEFCGSCGNALSITQRKMTSFPDAIRLGFQHYFDFRSRSTRAEYWWWVLFTVLVNIIFRVVEPIDLFNYFEPIGLFSGLFFLALLIPSFAVGARRLHDINKSGWWQLGWVVFFYIIPVISLLWWATKPSDKQTNKYD